MEVKCLICMHLYCGPLSRSNIHTGLACPRCIFDATPQKLIKGGKFCFMSHRRWLDGRHRFRLARMRFDGTIENRNPPLAIRKTLPNEVCSILIDLCLFFRQLCNKVLKMDELDQLLGRIILTLCHM